MAEALEKERASLLQKHHIFESALGSFRCNVMALDGIGFEKERGPRVILL